jgi:hypothetical protein
LRSHRYLLAWCVVALLVIVARPTGFSLQFLVGLGFPLLALGAFGLAAGPPRRTYVAAALLAVTAVTAVRFVSRPLPPWLTARDNMDVVAALRRHCREGDVLFAPPDLGLFAYGLTACRSVASHAIAPDHAARLEALHRFGPAPPAERAVMLDELRARFLVLVGDAGEAPVKVLGEDTPFRRVGVFGPRQKLALYERRP